MSRDSPVGVSLLYPNLNFYTDSVFWIEQTFPLGQRVVFEHNSQKNNASILWTGETLNIKNSGMTYHLK